MSNSAQTLPNRAGYVANSVNAHSGGDQRAAMSITSLFPEAGGSQKPAQEAFEREVAARFGLVPNFFRSAPDAPFVVHELWRFAKAAYLDAPFRPSSRNDFLSTSRGSARCAIASPDTAVSCWGWVGLPVIPMRRR